MSTNEKEQQKKYGVKIEEQTNMNIIKFKLRSKPLSKDCYERPMREICNLYEGYSKDSAHQR